MPTPLSSHLVEDSLAALSDWTGDTSSISRTVRLDSPDQVVSLVEAVAVSGESLGHRPTVERDGTAVTFTLPESPDAPVTEVDIALASHIDNLAGRLVGARPTPAPRSSRAAEDVYDGPGRNHSPSLTVDHPDQSATPTGEKRRIGTRRRAGGDRPAIGIPSTTSGGLQTPGLALPDEGDHRPDGAAPRAAKAKHRKG